MAANEARTNLEELQLSPAGPNETSLFANRHALKDIYDNSRRTAENWNSAKENDSLPSSTPLSDCASVEDRMTPVVAPEQFKSLPAKPDTETSHQSSSTSTGSIQDKGASRETVLSSSPSSSGQHQLRRSAKGGAVDSVADVDSATVVPADMPLNSRVGANRADVVFSSTLKHSSAHMSLVSPRSAAQQAKVARPAAVRSPPSRVTSTQKDSSGQAVQPRQSRQLPKAGAGDETIPVTVLARLRALETEKTRLLQENSQLLQKQQAMPIGTTTLAPGSLDDPELEGTINSLMKALSEEREARRNAEQSAAEIADKLEKLQTETEQSKQQFLDEHAQHSQTHSSSLRDAMGIIGDLRKSLQHALTRAEEAEEKAAQGSKYVAAQLIQGFKDAIKQNNEAAKIDPRKESLRGTLNDAITLALQNVQYSLVDVFGFEQANSVAAAMRGALVEPLLVVVPDIACRAEEAQVNLLKGSIPSSPGVDAGITSDSKKKFVLWLTMERERRHKAEMTLQEASEALARSETSRMEATQRWLNAVNRIELTQRDQDEESEVRSHKSSSVRSSRSATRGAGATPRGTQPPTPRNHIRRPDSTPSLLGTQTQSDSYVGLEAPLSKTQRASSSQAIPEANLHSKDEGNASIGSEDGVRTTSRVNGRSTEHKGVDWTTPVLFILMVVLYHHTVGFY